MSAAVVSTSVIGSAAMMIHRGGGSVAARLRIASRNVRALAKNSGASNRKMTQPGSCSAAGCILDVVVAREALDVVRARPGTATMPVGRRSDRERDRDGDARQDAEQGHAEERGHRQQELDPALAPEAA